ncbi:MAG: hypothetical protein ABI680_08490, partial [Chthoniobacteraceae bacterium]
MQTLEFGGFGKFVVCGLFIGGLVWLLVYPDSQPQSLDKVLIAGLVFLTALAQLWINHPNTFARNSRVLLMFGVCLFHLGIVKLMLVTADATLKDPVGAFTGLERREMWLLALPYSLAPLLMSVLLGRNHGIFAAI